MTMPKFEPVAMIGGHGHPRHISYLQSATESKLYGPMKPLYTADQLTEAYEAGKRDATPEWQPIETAPRGVLEILLRSPNGKISNGYWGQECNRGKGAWVWPYVKSEPSHWMPLPAAPKGLK